MLIEQANQKLDLLQLVPSDAKSIDHRTKTLVELQAPATPHHRTNNRPASTPRRQRKGLGIGRTNHRGLLLLRLHIDVVQRRSYEDSALGTVAITIDINGSAMPNGIRGVPVHVEPVGGIAAFELAGNFVFHASLQTIDHKNQGIGGHIENDCAFNLNRLASSSCQCSQRSRINCKASSGTSCILLQRP